MSSPPPRTLRPLDVAARLEAEGDPAFLDQAREENLLLDVPPAMALGDLRTPPAHDDPSELIRHRFLYRGAICLFCGPTGIGKSAMLMQIGIHAAVGRTLFQLEFPRPLEVLLVQAENDEGDMAEMRDGVMKGCPSLTSDEKARAESRFHVVSVDDRSGDAFADVLHALLEDTSPVDLLMIDPAFAYLGGDSGSQRDVSRFMREILNPLLRRHQVGLVLAHHTNKPLRGKEKEGWQAGDYAYLGAGSAEWVNPARAALAIRSIGSDHVFEFRAAKRGKRLRWVNAQGEPTTVQHIAHSTEPGVICWREATPEEVEGAGTKTGRPPKLDPYEVLHAVNANEGQNQSFYKAVVKNAFACSANTVQNALQTCLSCSLLIQSKDGCHVRYYLTEKGRERVRTRPSTHAWSDQ